MKAVVVTLDVDMPSTEMDKQATVTIEGRNYTGKVTAIIEYTLHAVTPTKVTLEAVGLKAATP